MELETRTLNIWFGTESDEVVDEEDKPLEITKVTPARTSTRSPKQSSVKTRSSAAKSAPTEVVRAKKAPSKSSSSKQSRPKTTCATSKPKATRKSNTVAEGTASPKKPKTSPEKITSPTFTLPDGQVLTEDDIHRQHAMFHAMASKLSATESYDEDTEDAEVDFSFEQYELQEENCQQPQLVHPTHTVTTPPVITRNSHVRSPSPAPLMTRASAHPTESDIRGLPAPSPRHVHHLKLVIFENVFYKIQKHC